MNIFKTVSVLSLTPTKMTFFGKDVLIYFSKKEKKTFYIKIRSKDNK